MGQMTAGNKILMKFSDYPAFTYRDVCTYLGPRSKRSNISRTLSYLKSKGKIFTLQNGVYTTRKDDAIVGFGFSPFYYGLLYALTIRELWTQNAEPEIVTLKRVRRSKISPFGKDWHRATLHHAKPKHFFGFDIIKYGGINVPVSDPEKTMIDLFYYKMHLPIQSYAQLLAQVKVRKIRDYLKRYDRRTKTEVMDFISKYKHRAKELESPY
jgi:predicted transcriptional regulator of viral defense system